MSNPTRLTSDYPFADIAHACRGATHVYALTNVVTGHTWIGGAADMWAAARLWAFRLANPDGNPGVPLIFKRALAGRAWSPHEWRIRTGRVCYDQREASQQATQAIRQARYGTLGRAGLLLHADHETTAKARQAAGDHDSNYRDGNGARAQDDRPMKPPEFVSPQWEDFLRDAMVVSKRKYPTDEQVRALWVYWHAHQRTPCPDIVYDPGRAGRVRLQARDERYYANRRAVAHGERPRTHRLMRPS